MTPDQKLALGLAAILLATTLASVLFGILEDRRIERLRAAADARRSLAKRVRMIALMRDGSPWVSNAIHREGC